MGVGAEKAIAAGAGTGTMGAEKAAAASASKASRDTGSGVGGSSGVAAKTGAVSLTRVFCVFSQVIRRVRILASVDTVSLLCLEIRV